VEGGVTIPWSVLVSAASAYGALLAFIRYLYERERREDKEEIRDLKHLLGRSVAADALPREARGTGR
jgi:hypothetical protein